MRSALIIGGTGSLGRALLRRLIHTHSVTVLSRDEHKQQALLREYPGVRFVLGDIRDYEGIRPHFYGKTDVFHAAALKHVDHLELNVSESIKTNVLGSINVFKCAVLVGHSSNLVFCSTDKAVDPINAYGFSKALAERFYLTEDAQLTNVSIYRWGNVLGSTGSAIPFFVKCLASDRPVPITDPEMTRFWLTIDQAADFMVSTMDKGSGVKIHPLMKSARVVDVVETLGRIMNKRVSFEVIGKRLGEKLHESLVSQHVAGSVCSKTCVRYSEQELRVLLEPIVRDHAGVVC